MKKVMLVCTIAVCVAKGSFGQTDLYGMGQQRHKLTADEEVVYKNVSTFHMNFNAHEFEKNRVLVSDTIKVNSNGSILMGGDAFVKRIARFVVPFPDIHIQDVVTVVDGNTAAIRYVMTGTQDGDLQTADGVLPATHKKIRVDGSEFFIFNKDGKLISLVTITRGDQMMAQLKAN